MEIDEQELKELVDLNGNLSALAKQLKARNILAMLEQKGFNSILKELELKTSGDIKRYIAELVMDE